MSMRARSKWHTAALLIVCASGLASIPPASAGAASSSPRGTTASRESSPRVELKAKRRDRAKARRRHARRRHRGARAHTSHLHTWVSGAVPLKKKGATSPPPPSGDLLFDGSHIADFDLLQAAPDAVSEVPDPLGGGETSFQMTVDDSDVYPTTPTENPRAQALSTAIIDPGEEIWLETKFLLPDSFPAKVPGWLSLISIYGAPFGGSSPWRIGIEGSTISWQRNDTYGYDVPWEMPLVRGRWITILLHERFATDGWVEMWVDGQQVSFPGAGARIEMATMDSSNDQGPNAAKIMNYRQAGMFDSVTTYFGPLRLGRTRAAVEA
jgi:Polysaccharide lyase